MQLGFEYLKWSSKPIAVKLKSTEISIQCEGSGEDILHSREKKGGEPLKKKNFAYANLLWITYL